MNSKTRSPQGAENGFYLVSLMAYPVGVVRVI